MKRTRLHWRWVLAALVIAALAVAVVVPRSLSKPHSGGANATAPARAVPVPTARATAGDGDVCINALGSVTRLDSVTLRSRLDGQLTSMRCTGGQMVRAGDEAVLRNARASP